MMKSIKAVEFKDGQLVLIDQTKLPLQEEFIVTDDLERIAIAIERLEVRGAPAIGVAAAYAIALCFKDRREIKSSEFYNAYNRLAATRPTAVNLFWALDEMKNIFEKHLGHEELNKILLRKALEIHNEDIQMCESIAENGLQIFTKPSRVLTHCNAGALATGGGGTAVNVISRGYKEKLVSHVYVDETRPLLQGSRLTAYELDQFGIPFSINTDSTAAFIMKQNMIDLAVVGADRIAANGDTANKIGTYNIAVLCKYHNIPFYVAAPRSTIDMNCKSGDDIKIEERKTSEVTAIKGVPITRSDYAVYSPAFDVTPAELISGIITESKLFKPPYKF